MSDSHRLRARPAVVVLFAVAACTLVAATTLTAVFLSHDGPERCCATDASGSRPSPTTRSASSRPAGQPLCLIGSWRAVDEAFMVKFYTNQPELLFVGSGRQFEFRPDGTGVERLQNVQFTGSFRGRELRMIGNGSMDFTWTATDRAITYISRSSSSLVYSSYDQRGLIATDPVKPNPALNEIDNYACEATQVTESNSGTGFRSRWARTAGFGVYG